MTAPREGRGEPLPEAWIRLTPRFGVARTPFAAQDWPEQVGYRVFSALVETEVMRGTWTFGLRAPLVEAFVQRPAGSIVRQFAVGNVELDVSSSRQLDRELLGGVRFGLGVPTSGSSVPAEAHFPNAALALGSALEGWRSPGLFAPGRLVLTPGARLDLRHTWFETGGALDLPVQVRVDGASSAAPVSVARVAWTPVISGYAAAGPWARLTVGLRAWLTWTAVPSATLAGAPSHPFQAALQPQLGWAVGKHVALGFDVMLPLGGALAGHTFSGALSVTLRR